MAKKKAKKNQRAVVFGQGARTHTFVIGGPDAGDDWHAASSWHAVRDARALVQRMDEPYHLEGFTAEEEAAIRAPINSRYDETAHYRSGNPAHQREGNPHHLLEARNELTKAFGRPTGGNADWINSAWFVQGSGGSVNPNRPDVHPGLYATHSMWVVEQPEESEYCVILRDIDEKAGDTLDTELMCGPAAGIHSVIDAARSYAAGGLVGGRKGNPVLSSSSEDQPVVLVIWSKPIGRGYRADMRQYDGPLKMRALRAAVKKATRSGDQGGGLALAKSHPTYRMYSPIGEEGVPLLRVRAEDVAIDPTRHAPIQGADGNFYYDDDSRGRIHLDAKTSEFLAEFKRQASQPDRQPNPVPKKMPQFGSSVTPALQGLVRDVTGQACYQETCFVSPAHDGHAHHPRG